LEEAFRYYQSILHHREPSLTLFLQMFSSLFFLVLRHHHTLNPT
jgi:hypothetical protein